MRKGDYSTVGAHMPECHQRAAEWTPERLIRWARSTGEATAAVVAAIMQSRPHPEQGYRACLGIMRLAKSYGQQRCEAACKRALLAGAPRYRSVQSILKRRLDQLDLEEIADPLAPLFHENIRGPRYYD